MAKKKGKISVETSGKRKTAIARATVRKGQGRVRVNSQPIHIMEPTLARRKALEPVQIAEAMDRLKDVDIVVDVQGGGQMGQVDAIRTAIARGLVKWNRGAVGEDEELRDEYLRFDRSLLVNDPRAKKLNIKWVVVPVPNGKNHTDEVKRYVDTSPLLELWQSYCSQVRRIQRSSSKWRRCTSCLG